MFTKKSLKCLVPQSKEEIVEWCCGSCDVQTLEKLKEPSSLKRSGMLVKVEKHSSALLAPHFAP